VRLRDAGRPGHSEDTSRPLRVRARHVHRAQGQAGGPAADAGNPHQADPDKV